MIYYKEEQIKYHTNHSKNIRNIRITKALFDCLIKYHLYQFQEVNFEEFKLICHGLVDKNCQYFYTDPNPNDTNEPYKMIFNLNFASDIFMYDMEKHHEDEAIINELKELIKAHGKYHYDYCFICSNSASIASSKAEESVVITAKKWLSRQINSHFTHDTLEKFVKEHGDETRTMPLRVRCAEDEVIHKWYDCTYMDIHKAHASELMKMFAGTGIDKVIQNQINKGIKLKRAGDLAGYKKTKDIVNLAVGMLGKVKKDKSGKKIREEPDMWLLKCNTRPLYNRIVNNIRAKINKQWELMSGDNFDAHCIYAQTDGLIVQHSNPVTDSDKIGEFGLEFTGTVYTYHCNTTEDHTGYTIYQYTDKEGSHVTGDLPDELKQHIDLEHGKVVIYKKTYDELGMMHNKLIELKEVKINEEK